MVIRAKVIDIRSTDPTGDFAFLVDSNAWYWMTYTRATIKGLKPPETYQLEQYLRFMKKARDAGASIFHYGLSFAELAHRIEDCERRIFSFYRRDGADVKSKTFRADGAERTKVLAEIETAWTQVVSMSRGISFTMDDNCAIDALKLLKECAVDSYDALHVQNLFQGKLSSILTDDADFATVPGIAVLTSNIALLKQAAKSGQLMEGRTYFEPQT